MHSGYCMRCSAVLWFTHSTENKSHRIVIPHIQPTAQPASFLVQRKASASNTLHGISLPATSHHKKSHSTKSSWPANRGNSSRTHHQEEEEEQHQWYPNPQITNYLPKESVSEFNRAQHLGAFHDATEQTLYNVWRDSKSHLRQQSKLTEELGLEGAVRETLVPTRISFREQLRQRPLDRAILEEIYGGLHGLRSERMLKKGLQWEHWIAKGDGTAPIYTTNQKAQQAFAFGGHIKLEKVATHPHHFPTVRFPGATLPSLTRIRHRTYRTPLSHHKSLLPRECLLPEVAFIGRTSSGKSSLINAIVNATITPYSAIRGTTDAVRFYNIASKIMLVDCPGYGYYHPFSTPSLDAENATKVMRAYLRTGAQGRSWVEHSSYQTRQKGKKNAPQIKQKTASIEEEEEEQQESVYDNMINENTNSRVRATTTNNNNNGMAYQPRNIKRVFLCANGMGLQHIDYQYCDLLEQLHIPFSVVFTKTDTIRIRELARLVDYTRCQLINYKQCKELMLTSALRLAGINKMQMLIASMAVVEDGMHGATTDFDSIVE